MIKTFTFSFVVFSILSCFVAAVADFKSPSEIIRAVRVLQDQIVAGDNNGQSSLPKLLNQLAGRMLDYRSDLWTETKNLNALVIYILSGGQVRVGKKVLSTASIPEAQKKLLLGAISYVSGNETEAIKNLQDIDPRTLPPALGSHIALVQASLVVQENPAAAMKLLDLARLLSPGTLIEEAALRREIFLSDDTGNLDRFVFLAGQYLRRFRASLYFENFRIRFTKSIGRFAQRNDALEFAKLVSIIDLLTPEDQLSIYLVIAQASIINGKVISARLATEQAAKLAKYGSEEAARAKFYNMIVAAFQNDYETSLAELEGLHDLPLPKHDVELKDVIVAMLQQSHKVPQSWIILNEPEPADALHEGNQSISFSASKLIDQVRENLGETDELVKDVSP